MRFAKATALLCSVFAIACLAVAHLQGQDEPNPDQPDKHADRTKFLKDEIQKIEIHVTDESDKRDCSIQLQPMLRYNDSTHGVADSVLWRVGSTGRPIAFVTTEVYGPNGGRYRMNHEFTAVDQPHLTMTCGPFTWTPPAQKLDFTELKVDAKPSNKPALRMTQMKELVKRFTARQEFFENKVELRSLPTPLYRYQPSDKLNADGAIFAIAWGVNPEIMLFIESDGDRWSFACARTSAANLWVQFDGAEVWKKSSMNFSRLDTPTAEYAIADSPAAISPDLYNDPAPKDKP